MLTFDIPINIKVSAYTEEDAEKVVASMMERIQDNTIPVLARAFLNWDFIEFVTEEEEQ